MTFELMPRLARLTKVHGLILDGNDLAVQCATNMVDRADLKIPILQALKLCEFLSRLPYSVTLDTRVYSVTYTPMACLAQLTEVHGMVVNEPDVTVQCATATEQWTDIAMPLEQALTLREQSSSLMASFASGKKGEPERIILFVRPVSRASRLEIFRFLYKANRYMQALNKDEFNQRFNDVWINSFTLRDDGKYEMIQATRNGMLAPTSRNIDFSRLLVEVGEELVLRGLLNERSDVPPAKIRRLADESWCRRPDWMSVSQPSRESYSNVPKMLFKFGKAKHMRDMYERGEVFVKPASDFALAEGAARQDDELTVSWHREGKKVEFKTSDYYCWCCASVYDYRLFMDFESDACLAIRDIDTFMERFAHAVAAQVSGAKNVHLIPAYYYDPLSVSDDPTEFATGQDEAIQCAKHFRFAYQWEFRVVITRSAPPPLQPFKIEMGSLRDIAELIVATGS
jgi:hypothetical protein